MNPAMSDGARKMEHTLPSSPKRIRFLLGHLHELVSIVLSRPTVPADAIVARYFADRRYLGSHDRGFLADSLYDILRGVVRHRHLLAGFLIPDAIDRASALHCAAWLHEAHIAVDTALVADILSIPLDQLESLPTRLEQALQQVSLLPIAARASIRHGVPEWLVDSLLQRLGGDEMEEALAALDRQAPITLRVNRLAVTRDELKRELEEEGIPSSEGRYSVDALKLRRRLNVHGLRAFKRGFFEVQDEGSQIVSLILDPHPGWRVFDACAGAGGKTLHMAAIMKGRGEVWAHDVNNRRLADIKPRLKRSGAQNVRIVSHEQYRLKREGLGKGFDAVLIDAPCTGTGVLRRNPGARATLDLSALARLCTIQSSLLQEYAELVRPGGLLLYATCSLLDQENEAQIERFLAVDPRWSVVRPDALTSSMTTSEGYYRSWPHLHDTDALFAALLRRSKELFSGGGPLPHS